MNQTVGSLGQLSGTEFVGLDECCQCVATHANLDLITQARNALLGSAIFGGMIKPRQQANH